MSCYANLSCLKNSFGNNLDLFHDTWINILNNTTKLPNNVQYIDINPGIIIDGKNNTVNFELLKEKIITNKFLNKLTVIATPVFFIDFLKQGNDKNHFCALYITIDTEFGPRKIPKISINYFNPHGYASVRMNDEIEIINNLRNVLLEEYSKNNNNLLINIRTHIYNGINLQERDPMGMCIFYGFTILTFFMREKISNKNINNLFFNITINQLVDEILDTFLYETSDNCEELNLVANFINQNIMVGGSNNDNDNDNEKIKLKQLINYINYNASPTHLKILSNFLKINTRNKKKIIKLLNNDKTSMLKLHKKIFK